MLTDRPGIPRAALTPGPGLYPGGHLKPVLIIYLPHVGFTPKPELCVRTAAPLLGLMSKMLDEIAEV